MMKLGVVLVTLCVLGSPIYGEPTGTPEAACGDMIPLHDLNVPQETEPPYTLSATSQGDGTFAVSITAEEDNVFRGFFIQARHEEAGTLHGVFTLVDEGDSEILKPRPCPEADGVPNGMTHVINSTKTEVSMIWDGSSEDDLTGISLRASVVQQFDTFWVGLTAELGQED